MQGIAEELAGQELADSHRTHPEQLGRPGGALVDHRQGGEGEDHVLEQDYHHRRRVVGGERYLVPVESRRLGDEGLGQHLGRHRPEVGQRLLEFGQVGLDGLGLLHGLGVGGIDLLDAGTAPGYPVAQTVRLGTETPVDTGEEVGGGRQLVLDGHERVGGLGLGLAGGGLVAGPQGLGHLAGALAGGRDGLLVVAGPLQGHLGHFTQHRPIQLVHRRLSGHGDVGPVEGVETVVEHDDGGVLVAPYHLRGVGRGHHHQLHLAVEEPAAGLGLVGRGTDEVDLAADGLLDVRHPRLQSRALRHHEQGLHGWRVGLEPGGEEAEDDERAQDEGGHQLGLPQHLADLFAGEGGNRDE